MSRQHWYSTAGPSRGLILLLHGLSSMADSWWQMGPALAADGWDVTAVDQAGHGCRPLIGPVTEKLLATAIRDVVSVRPDVLIGHSMGTLTALALVEDDPRWADKVILEEPGSVVDRVDVAQGIATSVVVDHEVALRDRAGLSARVRDSCPQWDDRDVHWAVEGIAQMQPAPFARWFGGDDDQRPQFRLAERVLSLDPLPYVLAANCPRSFSDGGSALVEPDRSLLEKHLPQSNMIQIDGGHCLHRDAPLAWLTAVRTIIAAPSLDSSGRER